MFLHSLSTDFSFARFAEALIDRSIPVLLTTAVAQLFHAVAHRGVHESQHRVRFLGHLCHRWRWLTHLLLCAALSASRPVEERVAAIIEHLTGKE